MSKGELKIRMFPIDDIEEYERSLAKAMISVAEDMFGEELVYEVIQKIKDK